MSTRRETTITGCNYENTSLSTININGNVSQVKHINQVLRSRKIKIYKLLTRNNPNNSRRDFCLICRKLSSKVKETCSTPNLNDIKNEYNIRSGSKSCNEISSPFKCPIIVNRMKSTEYSYSSRNLRFKRGWKVYRCQFNTQEESCCCSCNSDAMFEVMKSLYDCYKKKNCDNCNCILCGHLPREERRLGKQRKSEIAIKDVSVTEKMKEKIKAKSKKISKKFKAEELIPKKGIPSAKLRKVKAEGLLTPLERKTPEQKEKILRGLAMNGIPLPSSKTASEKKLIDKVRKDLGLPPEPLTPAESKKYNNAMESGLITPLEGKSASEKEKILKGLASLGISLPEGRTPSEQSLIKIIKEKARIPSIEKAKAEGIVSKKRIPSAKLRKAKAEGLLTPLEGKTPEQKEKILKGLAMNGIPLPPSKTASEKNLIDKVRKDLGLPPEPLTPAEKKKYNKAMESGLITPLEGKSGSEKEKVLGVLADLGVSLPEGRTPSEQSLIKNIREKARVPSIEKAKAEGIVSKKRIPSAKLRKAKAEGLLTPLEGKTPEQKEKILRGLAMNGIPLPPSKTVSERKLIDKVRRDLGLPPEPITPAEKNNYDKAMKSGLITPLEGKSSSEKKRILKGLHDMGIPLTEGRTRSEKNLIKKIKTGKVKRLKSREKGIGTPALPLEERKKLDEKTLKVMKEGKGPSDECICGLLTPESERVTKVSKFFPPSKISRSQRKKMLIKQAEMGVPLPEGRTPSEKVLIEELRSPLEGKTPEEKEKILRNLVKAGLQLPEGKTPSEKQAIKKVKQEMGIVSEASEKLRKSKAAGLLTPLEGKTPAQKEEILKSYIDAGLPLPETKTPSEKKILKDLIAKSSKLLRGKTTSQKENILRSIAKQGLPLPEPKTASEKAITENLQRELGISPEILTPSKKFKRAQAAGLLTPLMGKKPEEKERILRDLAKAGIPLPEAKTASEQKIIDKVRQDLGLPPEPKTPSLKEKMKRAQAAGIITPLDGKTPSEQEKVLRKMHEATIPLPKGRTKSEKSLIKKIEAEEVSAVPSKIKKPSEKLREAKAKGIVTPLEGKSIAHKEKILRGLAKSGLPLPEGKTPSEKALIAKIQAEEGVIPSRPTPLPEKYIKLDKKTAKVMKEGKGPSDECICGLLTPESEKEKIRLPILKKPSRKIPSEKIPKLEGKSPKEKEKILKDLAMQKLPLPEPKTASERKLIDKVREELGLPPHPKSPSAKENYNKAMAAGLITPLQGKTASQKEKILRGQAELGLPLPEGRTPSEKALIAKIKAAAPKLGVERISSEKMQKLKAAGLLTPLTGKTPEQKEKILKGLAMHGVPLPEPKTASERKLTDKVRAELGLPPHPKTPSAKENYNKAIAAGLITPLQGKSASQKEKILRGQAELGLSLPEGRNPSEKALIAKIKAAAPKLGVERIPSEKMQKLKAAGLLTPLTGKTPEQKEKILKGIAMHGVPLPEPKTASERKLTDKVRAELGLPPHPKTPSAKENYNKAIAAGLITPLQGKSASQKEKILRGQAELGLSLPEGRNPSEKALIAKIKAAAPKLGVERIPSEKMQKLKAAGLLTPLTGKTPEQKEKILKGIAMHGVPLPEPKTASERKLTDKVRAELGLPPHPKTPSAKENYNKAIAAGLITPLQGKPVSQKEKILRGQAELGLPLPEGRTPSEKALIAKIKATAPKLGVERIPSEKMQKLKAAGLLTPLTGKTPEQKEKILKGLAMHGVPLPEPKTASERKLTDKVRAEFGLPPHPTTPSAKENYNKAMAAGLITPLQGKSASQKERILKGVAELGIPLPEGRTPSEKVLIEKIKAAAPKPIVERIPSEKLQKLKAAGLLTPLTGKTPEQKEKILKGLAMNGVPLPEPKTTSERKLNDKVRTELGLPPHPKTPSAKENYNKAMAAGFITPLQGKSDSQKEKILKGQAELGIPLPEGRTPSEKAIIEKIKSAAPKPLFEGIPSEKLQKIKAAGLLTPLTGKTPEQKEKILKGLAMNGVPLPEPKTASERKLIDKVRAELGLPPEPKTSSEKFKYKKALAAGLITPLQGKSVPQKEKILHGQAEMGLNLPEGRTQSEKALIQKIKETSPPKIKREPSQKSRKSKVDEILATLKGKTPRQKEEILKDLVLKGIRLPEGTTASEKKIINKVRAEVGLPLVSMTPSKKEKYVKVLPLPEKLAELDKKTGKIMRESKGPSDECICKLLTPEFEKIPPIPKLKTPSKISPELYKVPSKKLRKVRTAGLLTPLQGKSKQEKEKILKGLAMNGIPVPEGKTASEKKLIDKILNEIGLPPQPKSPSMKEKYNQAIVDDIIIPLEGKTNAEKEKILKRQAELGLPLPVGRTPSEKAIIAKIKATAPKPAEARIPSEKIRKAKAAGLLTPLEGKTPEKKEQVLKGLIEAGMPLPEGKTPSEKALIRKVLTQAGVSPETMPAAKKSKIKTKSKKIGAVEASARRVGLSKLKGGIVEEFQDIIKTTTCDRGCGCDKKKIRFKHSYVKIRVTSPDISSLCPCPEECVPGVKGGVFTDNEGIKVTVGRVTEVASFSSRKAFKNKSNNKINKTVSNHGCNDTHILKNIINNGSNMSLSLLGTNIDYSNENHNTKSETEIYSHMRKTKHNFHGSYFNCFPYDYTSNNSSIEETDLIKSPKKKDFSNSLHHIYIHTSRKENSTGSIYLFKTISTVSLVTLPDTVSVWSVSATSTSATCTSNLNESKTLEDLFLQSAFGSFSDISFDVYDCSSESSRGFNEILNYADHNLNPEVQIYIANKSKTINTEKSKEEGPFAIVESLNSANSILKLLYRQFSQNEMYNTSSFIVIMSSSSDNCSSILPVNNCSSTICLELFENQSIWNTRSSSLHHVQQKGFKIAAVKNFNDQKKCTDTCKSRMISMDTTEDRPCCCLTKAKKSQIDCTKTKQGKVDNILSEFVTPIIHKEVVARESYNVWNCPIDTTGPSYISFSHSQLCRVPPCRGSTGCHYKNKPKYHADVASNDGFQDKISKPCHCKPPKLKGMLEKKSNQLISKSCGISKEALCEKRVRLNQRTVQVPYEVTNRTTKMSCDGCDLSKLNLRSDFSSDKKTKRACPCGEPKKDLDVSTKNNTEESIQYKKDQKRLIKYKNVVCECPEEPESELIDFEIDEKQMRKIKSDLTQTLSGFKIDILKKSSDSMMSFEEALRYFAENLEKDHSTKKNTSIGCECPFEPVLPQVEPFVGIKFHIDGKGTATKGLSGILCFE